MVEERIRYLFLRYPDCLYGFTDISYSRYAEHYKSALVFAVPYGELLTMEGYTEERFEGAIREARQTEREILAHIEKILDAHTISYLIPPAVQNNEEELAAPFSFKYAAVCAGLGWIGKNDVVVTEKYGPRVRLSAVLIDSPFAYGNRITESRCPDSCRKCVEACPCHALRDRKWNIDVMRNEMIDYQLCNQKRSLYIEKHGRKHSCGLCIAACPVGVSALSAAEDAGAQGPAIGQDG